MSIIDEKILESLSGEDRDILESYGNELGLFGLIAESFRGKLKAYVIAIFLLISIFAVFLVYCAIYFFTVEDIGMKLNWMAGGLTALFVVGLLRIAYIMELNRLSVIREVKRLGLQISLLSKKQ